MTSSMTAFARFEESGDWGRAIWEIRTVNHRYLDMAIRLPEELRMLENAVRERISATIKRGKVDCILRFEAGDSSAGAVPVNTALAEKLIRAAESLPLSNPSALNPMDVLRWPGVIDRETPDIEALGKSLLETLNSCLPILLESRQREGAKLELMLLDRSEAATQQVNLIREKLPEITEKIRERYIKKANDSQIELDSERLELGNANPRAENGCS